MTQNPQSNSTKTMKDLIINLEVIRITAKQLHYSESGEAFYANHLLMDRIAEHLSDFVDEIIEASILADTGNAPILADLYSDIASKTPKTPSKSDLKDLILTTIYLIDDLAKKDRFQGDFDLLGRISNNLRSSLGLLNRVLAGSES